ncbi:hypothetical protein O5281_26725, partial [Escherichia coli]|nr:hypothetical protein [Escherichia coli]
AVRTQRQQMRITLNFCPHHHACADRWISPRLPVHVCVDKPLAENLRDRYSSPIAFVMAAIDSKDGLIRAIFVWYGLLAGLFG